MTKLILSVSLAILISSLCSIAEAAFYSFPWSMIERLRKQGKASGHILYAMRKDVEKPITAILTLNTVAHTAGASIAGAAWAELYGEQTLFWFALVFTLLILIISEIIPKTVGVAYARSLGPVMAKPLQLLVWVFMPAIWVCGLFTMVFRKKKKRTGSHGRGYPGHGVHDQAGRGLEAL